MKNMDLKKNKIILYGAGRRCKRICEILNKAAVNIIAIIDSDSCKHSLDFFGHKVFGISDVKVSKDCLFCITIADNTIKSAVRQLIYDELNLQPHREINYDQLMIESLMIAFSDVKENTLQKNQTPSVIFDCANGLGLGGIEAWTLEICSLLLNNGMDNVSIMTDNISYSLPNEIDSFVDKLDFCHSSDIDLAVLEKIITHFINRKPLVFISSQKNYSLEAAMAVRCLFPNEIKIISVIHGGLESNYNDYASISSYVDVFVGVSIDIVENMKLRTNTKTLLMTCPFECAENLERLNTLDPSLPLKLGYAGRIEKSQKRFDLMMKLIETLEEMHVNYVFDVAGTGDMQNELNRFILENNLSNRVRCIGRIKRELIPSFWKSHDIYVNIADYEGHSISQMEAMGNGAIPVTTSVSGTKEDIIHKENGFLVPIGDYTQMAEYIKYIDQNRQILPEMSKLAHETMYPKSIKNKHIQFWINIIRSLEWTLLKEQ